ncbi:hypothetical protein [Vibrio tetraodonis]|uniref:hypothetical protein n=1 Tax=Vibrio tetraodonis TaxID=2231647 RepID=UPI000E0ADC8B|nr:hypothetical protein [Vibrio tetraodonis]
MLKKTSLSISVALSLSSGAALAQASTFFSESMQGLIWSDGIHSENGIYSGGEFPESARLTFAEDAFGPTINFDFESSCGSVSGTILTSPSSYPSSAKIAMKLDSEPKYTRVCSEAEKKSFNTFLKADHARLVRPFVGGPGALHLSSTDTGDRLYFEDQTSDIQSENAYRSVYNTYWVRESVLGSPGRLSMSNYLQEFKSLTPEILREYGFSPLSKDAGSMRITRSTNTKFGQVAEMQLSDDPSSYKFSSDEELTEPQFKFDDLPQNSYSQGTINFGKFSEQSRHPDEFDGSWANDLLKMNVFQYDNDRGGIGFSYKAVEGADALDAPAADHVTYWFKRFAKEATIADLKNTKWIGRINGDFLAVSFSHYSLNDILMTMSYVDHLPHNDTNVIRDLAVKFSTNNDRTGRLAYASGVDDVNMLIRPSRFINSFTNFKAIVLDYSYPSSRGLHIVTENETFSFLEYDLYAEPKQSLFVD